MTTEPRRPLSSTTSPVFSSPVRTTPGEIVRRESEDVVAMPVAVAAVGTQLDAVRASASHALAATAHLEERCRTLRAQHRCPGRCVLTGLERRSLSNQYSQDLRR